MSAAHEAATVEGCPVTKPNGMTPPGETPGPRHHGNGSLWTVLHDPTLTVTARNRQPDGSVDEKFPWWRGVSGNLSIRGLRIDGSAPPLRARILSGYGDSGFQASAIIFPTEGCWRVTGTSASRRSRSLFRARPRTGTPSGVIPERWPTPPRFPSSSPDGFGIRPSEPRPRPFAQAGPGR